MNIEGAWKRGYTGKNIVVTILDDGIERTHPDLMQNYVSGYCGHNASLLGNNGTHVRMIKMGESMELSQVAQG